MLENADDIPSTPPPGQPLHHAVSNTKEFSAMSFLQRLAEQFNDGVPDGNKLHLPNFQKHEVYERFLSEFRNHYDMDPPSAAYFLRILKFRWRQAKNEGNKSMFSLLFI